MSILKIGHRGAKGYVAENTFNSIKKAIQLNADGIENDTGSKLGSVKWEWNPYVLVTGLGWHKIWDNGVSFSIKSSSSALVFLPEPCLLPPCAILEKS